jgi:hypothetical protein
MMRIWNPSHFYIGKGGRSNCPRWRGQDYRFKPNETKEVTDLCGRWLITEFGYYGLVSLPDRNVVQDNDEYDKAVESLRKYGIQQLYKWAVRVVDQWRQEAKKRIDNRESMLDLNDYVIHATQVLRKYQPEIALIDPETIKKHKLMREILGTVEHDSDKLLDQALQKEISDADKNARQYSHKQVEVKVDEKPLMPGEPTKASPISDARKSALKKATKKRRRKQPSVKKAAVENTMESMKVPINLDQNAL